MPRAAPLCVPVADRGPLRRAVGANLPNGDERPALNWLRRRPGHEAVAVGIDADGIRQPLGCKRRRPDGIACGVVLHDERAWAVHLTPFPKSTTTRRNQPVT